MIEQILPEGEVMLHLFTISYFVCSAVSVRNITVKWVEGNVATEHVTLLSWKTEHHFKFTCSSYRSDEINKYIGKNKLINLEPLLLLGKTAQPLYEVLYTSIARYLLYYQI